MTQMKIQDLFSLLKPGFVAMDKNGIWRWYAIKPRISYDMWYRGGCSIVKIGDCFDLLPFDGDWKDSLMECGNIHDIIDPKLSGPVNATSYPLKTEWEIKADDKITTTLTMDKETYDWLTTPGEDDDVGCWQPEQVTELDEESFDKFAKEVYNKEVDVKKVEAAKKIFEGIDKVDVKIED